MVNIYIFSHFMYRIQLLVQPTTRPSGTQRYSVDASTVFDDTFAREESCYPWMIKKSVERGQPVNPLSVNHGCEPSQVRQSNRAIKAARDDDFDTQLFRALRNVPAILEANQ